MRINFDDLPEEGADPEEGMDVIEPATIDGRPAHKPLDPTKVSFESLGYTPLNPGEDPLTHDFRIDTKSRNEIPEKKKVRINFDALPDEKQPPPKSEYDLGDATIDPAAANAMGGAPADFARGMVQKGIASTKQSAAETKKAWDKSNIVQKNLATPVGAVDFLGKGMAGLADQLISQPIALAAGSLQGLDKNAAAKEVREFTPFGELYQKVLGKALTTLSPAGTAGADTAMAPFAAPGMEATERWGPFAGFMLDTAMAVTPGAGVIPLRAAMRGPRVKPKPKGDIEAGLSDPNLSKEGPLANVPTEPAEINPFSREWQDMSTELGGETPAPRESPIQQMKKEARRIVVDEEVKVDPMADLKDYKEMAAGERPPKRIEPAELQVADEAWGVLTRDLDEGNLPDLVDNDPFPDGDLVEAMDAVVENDFTPNPHTTPPSETFLNAMRKKQGGWVDFWGESGKKVIDWASGLFRGIVSEDSRRGAATRWKLMEDAALLEKEIERQNNATSTSFDPKKHKFRVVDTQTGYTVGYATTRARARASVDRRDNEYGAYRYKVVEIVEEQKNSATDTTNSALEANKAAGRLSGVKKLDPKARASIEMALGWVSRTLPRLFAEPENGIWFLSKSDMQMVYTFYEMHSRNGTLAEWQRYVQKQYPDVWNYIDATVKAKTKDGFPQLDNNFVDNDGWNGVNVRWDRGEVPSRSAVILNTDNVKYFSNPINAVGTLVHELLHARQWKARRQNVVTKHLREIDSRVPYAKLTHEQTARQGEETARIKFVKSMEQELRAMGIMPEKSVSRYLSPDFPSGAYATRSSYRATQPSRWTAGAVGTGRAPPIEWTTGLDAMLDRAVGKLLRDGGKLAEDLSNTLSKDSVDLSDTGEMPTKDFVEALGPVDHDMRLVPGFRSASHALSNSLIAAKSNATKAIMVGNHFLGKVKRAIRNEHAANHDMVNVFRDFEAHYIRRLAGNKAGRTNLNQFAKDAKIAVQFELDPQSWFNGKDWYPSEQQLVQKGMSPESAKLWRSVFDQLEQTWGTLEAVAKQTGRKVPKRIPGYLPHTTHGAFRVTAYLPDKDGTPVKYFAELGARNRKEANHLEAELKKIINDPKIVTRVQDPQPTALGIDAMLDGIRATRDAFESSKGITALTKMIEDNAARSVLSHMLDRTHPTKFGHTLQRAAEKGTPFELDTKQMRDAVKTFTEYARAVNGYAERVRLVNETLIPLDEAGLLDSNKNLRRVVYDYFKNYIGIDKTMIWDDFFRDALGGMGYAPSNYNKALGKMQSTFAHLYLFANVPFYVVNSAQFTSSLPILWQKAAEVRLSGGKAADVLTAIDRGSKRVPNLFSLDSMMKDPDMAWGQKHGYLDPQAIELLDPDTFHDPITQNIDRMTRRIAFSYGLEFWKQIKPLEEARILAGEFANEVAVPYSHKAGAPVITGRLGPAFKAMTMFSTYPAHVMGMLERQARLINEGRKRGDMVMTAEAAGAMVGFTGLQIALWGISAMPLVAGIDKLMEMINDLMGRDAIPTSTKVARAIDKATGFPGGTEFGLPSAAIQAVAGEAPYVSGSASGVMPVMPTAFWRGIASTLDIAVTGGLYLAGKRSEQEVYEATKGLPTFWGGVARNMLRDKGATTDQRGVHEAGEKRSQAMQILSWAGIRSLSEQSSRTTDHMSQLSEKRIADQIRRLNDKLAYSGSLKGYESELMKMMTEYKTDPEVFFRALETAQSDRTLSPDMRRAMAGIRSRSPASYMRYLDLKKQETVRPPQP